MEKSVNDEVDLVDVENPESATINSHIGQLLTLRKSVEKSNKKIQYWKKNTSNLLESNHNIEENFNKLTRKVSELDAEISADTKIHVMKKQELKDFENARKSVSHKKWDDCLSEIGNYANDFSQWITEYSRNVLMRKIEDHHEECKKIGDELITLKRKLDDMKGQCDSDYIEANVDVNDLPSLNNVISDIKMDNNNLMQATRSMEETLNKIESKIKQNKVVVNEYKKKEKTNIF